MAYDAVKVKDWQIAEAAEVNLPTPEEWRERLNLQESIASESIDRSERFSTINKGKEYQWKKQK